MLGNKSEWVARDERVVWHGFTQMQTFSQNSPIVVARADGHYLIDVDGKRYFDAISSLWVNTLGHRVPELDAALISQAARVAHSTMLGNANTTVIEFSEALAQVVPVITPHFLYCADGAVAVEQALKIAWQYWANRAETRQSFLALGDAYHGDTVGALSLGDQGFFTEVFSPLTFPVQRTPGYASADWADKAISVIEAQGDEFAAVVIEPLVQGASGMLMADPLEVARVGRAVEESGGLLICDEVATGFGRTGTLFASTQCNLRPDLLCLGKGITGGYLPMAATVASKRVYEAFLGEDLGPATFYHGHSYGGNALGAAVALAHLKLFEDGKILANARARSRELTSALKTSVAPHPLVRALRQHGLMVGIELDSSLLIPRLGRRVCAEAVAKGMLLRPLGDIIVLMPPLTITPQEVQTMVDVACRSLDAVWSEESDS